MSDMLLEALPKTGIADILIQRITDALISGKLKPGDQIPTEKEFTNSLGISRNSVREAIKVLVSFGVLEIRRGEGTFVVKEFNQKMLDPIVYGLFISSKSMKDLLEFKISFLNSVLYLVMKHDNTRTLPRLEELNERFCAAMLEEPGDLQKMYRTCVDVNTYLAEMCGNPLIDQMNRIVLKIAKFSRTRSITVSVRTGRRGVLPAIYRDMVRVIREGDLSHLPGLIDEILDTWKLLLLPSPEEEKTGA